MSTKCVCYGSWRMMKMADRDGEKDEPTEVLELFDHALLTGIRARTRLSRLCKSCLEMEWKVDDMTMAIVSNDILTDRQIAKHIAAH